MRIKPRTVQIHRRVRVAAVTCVAGGGPGLRRSAGVVTAYGSLKLEAFRAPLAHGIEQTTGKSPCCVTMDDSFLHER